MGIGRSYYLWSEYNYRHALEYYLYSQELLTFFMNFHVVW